MRLLHSNTLEEFTRKQIKRGQLSLKALIMAMEQNLITKYLNKKQNLMANTWKSVTYSKQNRHIPPERWGHRFVRVNEDEIVLFGGYGGDSSDGTYLQDLWSFHLKQSKWEKIQSKGDRPQPRSNYSIHFNDRTQQIMLFGGGTNNKIRFNEICFLNWETKNWRKVHPVESQVSPWERTYHSSEFVYPYLIVHGGESASGIDLDDMWVFNVQTEEWNQLQFNEGIRPEKRRFHSSAFVDGHFYVIGGCSGYHYTMLGDIYRVNLDKLLREGKYTDFIWENVIKNNKELERWGHSSDVFNEKIYITCGRISPSQDCCETFVFDPKTDHFGQYQIDPNERPKPRRRHSSIVIGNSLLIYGGYDGNYLHNFDYLPLKTEYGKQRSGIKILEVDSTEDMLKELVQLERKVKKKDIKLEVIVKDRMSLKMKTSRQALCRNLFFKNMVAYSESQDEISITLPEFSDTLSFRVLHSIVVHKSAPLSKSLNHKFYSGLLKTMQYFCCFEFHSTIEKILHNELSQQNCKEVLDVAFENQLDVLKEHAAEMCLKMEDIQMETSLDFDNYSSFSTLGGEEKVERGERQRKREYQKEYLRLLYNNMKFHIHQSRLRELNSNFLTKAANKIKTMLTIKTSNNLPNEQQTEHPNRGCFQRLFDCISNFCMKRKVRPEESHSE